MKKLTVLVLIVFTGLSAFSQNVAINNDGSAADASAILDIKSSTKGVVFPRMTQAERTAITSPAKGLLIYQTDGTEGLYYNSGTPGSPAWVQVSKTGTAVAFSAAFTSSYLSLSSGSYGKITFPTEEYDESSNFIPGATSTFTAPAAGIYHFDANITPNGASGGYLSFFVNNVEKKTTYQVSPQSYQNWSFSITAELKLAANDVVDVRFKADASGNMYNVTTPWAWFNGHKVN